MNRKQNNATSPVFRNLYVIAENTENMPGFNIYLVFSGERKLLMHHRRNGLLYLLLKDGMALNELRRHGGLKVSAKSKRVRDLQRQKSARLDSMVNHLLKVADGYLDRRGKEELDLTVIKDTLAERSYSVPMYGYPVSKYEVA